MKISVFVAHLLLVLVSRSLPVNGGVGPGRGEDNNNSGGKLLLLPKGMVATESNTDFETTWSNLITALQNNNAIRIVAQIDHSENANSVGLDLPPTRLVVFGNPNLGTPIMQQNIVAGIDLPQKMLVWQDKSTGKVYVGYNSVEYLNFRHPGVDDAETFSTVQAALANLALAATGQNIDDNVSALPQRRGLRTKRSDNDFETTWNRLLDAIEASPANVAFTVDHTQNANSAGLDLPPTRLVIFGNPNLGTPPMQTSPSTGIDLPLKILVWQDDNGHVRVTRNSITFLKNRHGLDNTNLDKMETALLNFVRAATQSSA